MSDTTQTGQTRPVANTKVRHVRVDDEVWNDARSAAAEQGESVAQFINRALRAYAIDANKINAAVATIRGGK